MSEPSIAAVLAVVICLFVARGLILLMLCALSRIVLTDGSLLIRVPWGIQRISDIQLRWLSVSLAGVAAVAFVTFAKNIGPTAARQRLRTWLSAISSAVLLAGFLLLLWSFGIANPQIPGTMLEAISLGQLLLLAGLLAGMAVALKVRPARDSVEGGFPEPARSAWLRRIVSAAALTIAALAWVKPTFSQHRAQVAVVSLVTALLLFIFRAWLIRMIADYLGSCSEPVHRPSPLSAALRRFFVEGPASTLHRTDVAVLAGVVALGGYLLWLGTPPQYLYPHDLFIYYDAAWRIVCGQRPHADYATAIGPLPQALYALGWWLAPQKGNSLAYGHAAFALLMSLWAWRVARTRMSAALTTLFVLLIAANSAALTCFGTVPFKSTFSMTPNRYGHSMLCLFTLMVCLRPAADRDRWRIWGLMSAGVLLAGMLFCKISFFVVAVGVIPVALLGRGIVFQNLPIIAAGFLLGSLPWLALTGFDPAALYRDYSISFVINRGGLVASILQKLAGRTGLVVFAAIVIPCVLSLVRRTTWPEAVRIGAVSGLLFAAGVVIREGDGIPAFVSPLWLASVICIGELLQRIGSRQWGNTLIVLICLCGLRDQVACDIASIVSPAISVSPSVAASRLNTMGFQEEAFHSVPGIEGLRINDARYADQIEEGRRFVSSKVGSDGRLVYLGFSNPFQSICRLRPPSQGVLWWHDGRTFDSDHHPAPETVFSEATHVLILKSAAYERMATRDVLLKIYGRRLETEFQIAAESPSFVLWSERR